MRRRGVCDDANPEETMADEQSTNAQVITGSAPTLVEMFAASVTPDGLLRLSTWVQMPATQAGAPVAGPGLAMTLAAADALAGLLRSEVNKATGTGQTN